MFSYKIRNFLGTATMYTKCWKNGRAFLVFPRILWQWFGMLLCSRRSIEFIASVPLSRTYILDALAVWRYSHRSCCATPQCIPPRRVNSKKKLTVFSREKIIFFFVDIFAAATVRVCRKFPFCLLRPFPPSRAVEPDRVQPEKRSPIPARPVRVDNENYRKVLREHKVQDCVHQAPTKRFGEHFGWPRETVRN